MIPDPIGFAFAFIIAPAIVLAVGAAAVWLHGRTLPPASGEGHDRHQPAE